MSKQKSLTSFFKPMQTKRMSTDSLEQEVNAKKPKLETCEETSDHAEKEAHEIEDNKPVNLPPVTNLSEPGEQTEVNGAEVKGSKEVQSDEGIRNGKVVDEKDDAPNRDERSYSQRSTQEVRDDRVTEKLPDDRITEKLPDDEPSCSQRSTQEARDDNGDSKKQDDDSTALKDITKDDENKSNFTTPVKSKANFVSTPLGMLSPLQCLAKIKSQCAKTPALHCSIGPTWFFALQSEFTKPYFGKLSQFLVAERKKSTIFPPEHQVWTWTQLCAIKDVKVVILGQDPYHNPRQAHGLCFSVQKGVPPPPSLVNMYKELESDIPGFKAPNHGNLTGWAQQGVLLLNACLTVRANNPNSHKDQGWEQLTDAVIKKLSDTNSGLVFLLWGSFAHKKGALVNKKKHHVLQTTHPSPLSAHRGFMGCKHFSKCNALLEKSGKKPIDWTNLPLA